ADARKGSAHIDHALAKCERIYQKIGARIPSRRRARCGIKGSEATAALAPNAVEITRYINHTFMGRYPRNKIIGARVPARNRACLDIKSSQAIPGRAANTRKRPTCIECVTVY